MSLGWLPEISGNSRRVAPLTSADAHDDVSGLLLGFHVPRCLDYVLQRVTPVNDRPELARFDELLEQDKVLLGVVRWQLESDFLATAPRGPQGQPEISESVGG